MEIKENDRLIIIDANMIRGTDEEIKMFDISEETDYAKNLLNTSSSNSKEV